MEHVVISGIGKRSSNQDDWTPKETSPSANSFIVCDGVGGSHHGDIASQITTESLATYFRQSNDYSQDGILKALLYAENALDIFKLKHDSAQNMSTTLSLLAFDGSNEAIASWVGDSRIYHIRNGKILFKSVDHSLGQLFVQRGLLKEEDLHDFPKKNVITQGVTGCNRSALPDFHHFTDIQRGDFFLVCSDGFYEVLTKEHFHLFTPTAHLAILNAILTQRCKDLATDNYTSHIIKI